MSEGNHGGKRIWRENLQVSQVGRVLPHGVWVIPPMCYTASEPFVWVTDNIIACQSLKEHRGKEGEEREGREERGKRMEREGHR